MLSPLTVPLQYLFLCWRAERLSGLASKGGRGHARLMAAAESAAARVETLQVRFPSVTDWIDARRRRDAMREGMAS